ncbi:MAG: DUF882 domain-containing protein [Polaromonas sp.]|nr:DUF882 domain-containing protein [Polaromonas sp.]
MTDSFIPARRSFLRHTGQFAIAAASTALPGLAVSSVFSASGHSAAMTAALESSSASPSMIDARGLAMFNTHTREKIDLVYATGQRYLPQALGGFNHFLRDHYTGEVGLMDPEVFDLLHRVQQALGTKGSFEVISGYRCEATNRHLRQTRGGGVADKSLHTEGRAIDVRLPGVPLAELRKAALSLRAGGVGFYPREQFVHIDTGRVRSW